MIFMDTSPLGKRQEDVKWQEPYICVQRQLEI